MRKALATIGLLALAALTSWAQTAEEIVSRMQSNQVSDTSRTVGRMTVKDRFGTKETRFVSYSRGESDALIEFTSPEEKGQKILRTRDEIYLFYPEAEEVIRLQGAAFRDAVLGSDMSYEDLTGGKTLLESYELALEGRETVDGAECFRIGMKARARNVAYPRQTVWVDAKLYVARRMEQYSLSGRLLKEMRLSDFRVVSGRTMPMRIVIEDKLKKNSSTELVVEEIELGAKLDPALFSLERLTW